MWNSMMSLPRALLIAVLTIAGALTVGACDGGGEQSQEQQQPPAER